MIITYRGAPEDEPDEPQHELMGSITLDLLQLLKIRWQHFPRQNEDIVDILEQARRYMEDYNLPYALVMKQGVVAPEELRIQKNHSTAANKAYSIKENGLPTISMRPSRLDILKVILKHKHKNDILIATTGKTGRELYHLKDADNHLYMVGSMGCASSLALGAALSLPNNRFICIDGDAALLMRMGNLASVGKFTPSNFVHILLDNEMNDSTRRPANSNGRDCNVGNSTNMWLSYRYCCRWIGTTGKYSN